MTSKGTKKNLEEIRIKIEKKMEETYEVCFDLMGKKCFRARKNEFFLVTALTWANAIVIEHAFSESEARKNIFEDGDLFYVEDMNEDEIYQGMIKEIEDE